ncbi:GNAT family N-acetyltransferase [Rhizosaccharibacter radicis]|uniref:GNAT family N-acetyltransferase n=1 Tax=Rhizosaccharibacter radicis TaxID=2782605 RepID=A0ABT1VXD0_9PROT|nr:GNAT family N-acetyltransferase [Acetobacteraceae bacterium KSS12]
MNVSWPSSPVTRIAVDVTFLRLQPANRPPPTPLPPSSRLERVTAPSVPFYRFLYNTVGGDYCWWLRRIASDAEIAALMRHPAISLHVLYEEGQPSGFFELDARTGQDVNLSYFGLMPHRVGTGVGFSFLQASVSAALQEADCIGRPGAVRVNTCTADHKRALPSYRRAGFVPVRTVREIWDIPDRLGLPIPASLRV